MSSAVDKSKVPWWVSNLIVPIVNLILALLVSALFIFIAGENPIKAVKLIIYGSFGYIEGFAYTLYYTTNFIFTGLAFAVAFHCRLFNIGGEGQAYIGWPRCLFCCYTFQFFTRSYCLALSYYRCCCFWWCLGIYPSLSSSKERKSCGYNNHHV